MLTRLVLRWAVLALAIWAAITFVPGIEPARSGWLPIIGLALIFGLLNALLRPLIELLTCPLIILTLGLGTLLINTLIFWLAGLIGNRWGIGFTVNGFWPAFFGALVVSVISVIFNLLLKDELRGRRRTSGK
jgi:putative membrane protein